MAAITTMAEADPGRDDAGWTLPELATRINTALDDAGAADDMANDRRIAAGRMLKIAKSKVARGYFKKWCERNIKRSRADVYRCLALVGEDDPWSQQEARQAEKQKARISMAASRDRRANVSTPVAGVPPVANVGDNSQPMPSNVVPLKRAPKDAVERLEKLYQSFKGAWQKAYNAEVAGGTDGIATAWRLAGESFRAIYQV